MNCYKHQDKVAVVLCRVCYRGMCNDCVPPQAVDISCSPVCASLIDHQYTANTNWINISIGLLFLGYGIWDYMNDPNSRLFSYFVIALGLIFIVGEIIDKIRINRIRKSLRYPSDENYREK